MTTITPDPETEEGKKLLSYVPGDVIKVTMTVDTNEDGELTATETDCEKVEAEGEEETEYEEPTPPARKSTMPKAIAIIAKK